MTRLRPQYRLTIIYTCFHGVVFCLVWDMWGRLVWCLLYMFNNTNESIRYMCIFGIGQILFLFSHCILHVTFCPNQYIPWVLQGGVESGKCLIPSYISNCCSLFALQLSCANLSKSSQQMPEEKQSCQLRKKNKKKNYFCSYIWQSHDLIRKLSLFYNISKPAATH